MKVAFSFILLNLILVEACMPSKTSLSRRLTAKNDEKKAIGDPNIEEFSIMLEYVCDRSEGFRFRDIYDKAGEELAKQGMKFIEEVYGSLGNEEDGKPKTAEGFFNDYSKIVCSSDIGKQLSNLPPETKSKAVEAGQRFVDEAQRVLMKEK